MKLFLWIVIFATSTCKNQDFENRRSNDLDSPIAEKILMGTDDSRAHSKPDSKAGEDQVNDGKDTSTSSEDSKNSGDDSSSKEPEVDPNEKPDDHKSADLEECFDSMPKDRAPGPFFKIEKVVTGWAGRIRTTTRRVPIVPPKPGLNLCRTILDECVICKPWPEINQNEPESEVLCDDYAKRCSDENQKPCKCVRS